MDVNAQVGSQRGPELAGHVVAVHLSSKHEFSKDTVKVIDLVSGHGVAGDAHAGARVQHLVRKKREPELPNLRQVHLIQSELFDELAADGFAIGPGDLGENVTTSGLDLLTLPTGATLRIGSVELTLTGLRNPCAQINALAPGLMKRLTPRVNGEVRFLAGVMTTVAAGGPVSASDSITVELPPGPLTSLQRV